MSPLKKSKTISQEKPELIGDDSEVLDIVIDDEKNIEGANDILSNPEVESEIFPEDSVTLLKKKVEEINLEEEMKPQVGGKVQDAQDLEDEEKIQYLIKLAQTKGAIFAVKVAQKMDNPYVLDSLHDALIEQGYYKKFE